MDALVTVASLEKQLAKVEERKRNLQATLHQICMVDLEEGVEAMQKPSTCPTAPFEQDANRVEATKPPTVPPQFVKLHIPKRDFLVVTTPVNATKPEAETMSATETAHIMVCDLPHRQPATAQTMSGEATKPTSNMPPPPSGNPRRKRSLSPCTAKPAKDVDRRANRQKENKSQHAITSEQGPTSKKSRVSTPLPLQIEQLRIEADQLHIDGDLVGAARVYISAINLSGPWTERSMHASLQFNSAVCHIKQERYDEAISHAAQAIKLEPTFAGAHYALGYAIAKGGKNLQLAMRHFKHFLKLKPSARVQLPNGIMFGSKDNPLYSEADALVVYKRQSCAHLKVPSSWTTRESRSQPGKIFFENLQTRATTWIVPAEKKKSFMSLNDVLATSSGSIRKPMRKKGAAAFLGT